MSIVHAPPATERPRPPAERLQTRLDCPCGRWLVLTNVELKPGEFIQAHCPKCKRERRFVARP